MKSWGIGRGGRLTTSPPRQLVALTPERLRRDILYCLIFLLFLLLFGFFASGAETPKSAIDVPAPKTQATTKSNGPVSPGHLLLVQSVAISLDIYSTARYERLGWVEVNPVVRAVAGPRPSIGAMVAGGIAEDGLSYLLAKKFPKMKWLQIGFSAGHFAAAGHNLALQRRTK